MSDIASGEPVISRAETSPPNRWAVHTLFAGFFSFAATTGALLAFARSRGGAWAPFAHVGRRVARNILLPEWVDVGVGLVVHVGHSLALAAIAAGLYAIGRPFTRLRAALIVAVCWQLIGNIMWLAVIRPDKALSLGTAPRVVLALCLVAAIAVGLRTEMTDHRP